jgi:translation initiation factor IF-2
MGKLNVTQFATELGLPVTLLLEQLKAAGIAKEEATDPLSEKDKAKLLEHLRQAHGGEKPAKKITLIRRETTEIKKADSSGRARTIQVEVRKRRVVAPAAAPEAAAPAIVEVAGPGRYCSRRRSASACRIIGASGSGSSNQAGAQQAQENG